MNTNLTKFMWQLVFYKYCKWSIRPCRTEFTYNSTMGLTFSKALPMCLLLKHLCVHYYLVSYEEVLCFIIHKPSYDVFVRKP